MVVNAAIADKAIDIFRQLYLADYRIERMVLIDNYDADDESSMRANNSSSLTSASWRLHYQDFQARLGLAHRY